MLLVAELAGTQAKLETLRIKFRELLKEKMELTKHKESSEPCSTDSSS